MVDVVASLANLQGLAAADDRSDAGSESSLCTLVYALISLTKIITTLGMTEYAILYANFVQHAGRNLAGESSLWLPMNILSTYMDFGALCSLGNSSQGSCSRAGNNVNVLNVCNQWSKLLDQGNALCDSVVHLPVTSDNRSTCHN